jgi:hypothetical protein
MPKSPKWFLPWNILPTIIFKSFLASHKHDIGLVHIILLDLITYNCSLFHSDTRARTKISLFL